MHNTNAYGQVVAAAIREEEEGHVQAKIVIAGRYWRRMHRCGLWQEDDPQVTCEPDIRDYGTRVIGQAIVGGPLAHVIDRDGHQRNAMDSELGWNNGV